MELTVKGVFQKKKEYIYKAIYPDPLTSALLTLEEARTMTDEMFAQERNFLPGDLR